MILPEFPHNFDVADARVRVTISDARMLVGTFMVPWHQIAQTGSLLDSLTGKDPEIGRENKKKRTLLDLAGEKAAFLVYSLGKKWGKLQKMADTWPQSSPKMTMNPGKDEQLETI